MDITNFGLASRVLPQAAVDDQQQEARVGRYGDLFIQNIAVDMLANACEGTYFTAQINSGTVGTGIKFTGDATTAFTDGNGGAGLVLQNTDTNPSSTSGKRIYLDYIKLICTTACTGNTNFNMAAKIDNVLSRYTSGGTVPTILNANMDSSNASIAKVAFGAPVIVASSSAGRLVWRQLCRTVATSPGVGDVIVINFGSVEKPVGGQLLVAAVGAQVTFVAPPVILGPGHTFTLHSWGTSQSAAPTLECEMGWIER